MQWVGGWVAALQADLRYTTWSKLYLMLSFITWLFLVMMTVCGQDQALVTTLLCLLPLPLLCLRLRLLLL
jgi:hypothetical protein